MSKYSGLFLSFLLIFLCLWINVCRYPRVWTMVNADGQGAGGLENGSDIPKETPPTELPETLETRNDSLSADPSDEPDSWVPKPVVITARPATEALSENDLSSTELDSESLAGHNVSGGKNRDFFKTANLSTPIDEESETEADHISYEKPIREKENDSPLDEASEKRETMNCSDALQETSLPSEAEAREKEQNDGMEANPSLQTDGAGQSGEKNVVEKTTGEKEGVEKNRDGSHGDKKNPGEKDDEEIQSIPNGDDISSVVILHSPYLAAGSPGTDRLNSDLPTYGVHENQAYPCGAKTIPDPAQKSH